MFSRNVTNWLFGQNPLNQTDSCIFRPNQLENGMKNPLLGLILLLTVTTCYPQTNRMNTMTEQMAIAPQVRPEALDLPATSPMVALLDKAVTAQTAGNKAVVAQALQAGTTALEAEAQTNAGSFRDKLLEQADSLKKLIPLALSGTLTGSALQKAVGLAKMAVAGSKIEQLTREVSLLPSAAGLTASLGILKSALPGLGGSAARSGGLLITSALRGVSALSGQGATVAESDVRGQLDAVLSFVKEAI